MILISFSGGKTSAYMSFMMKRYCRDDMVFVFANTGQEREQTLKFVDQCDKYFGLNLVWVEAVINDGKRGTTHNVVDFKSACRDGRVFEDMIKKYGIPNKSYPHCTRELKLAPIHSYMKTISNDYLTAIGIRADECRRAGNNDNVVYPFIDDWVISKEDVNNFWDNMFFTLELEEHQGNCSWCWKKSFKKHKLLIKENPEIYNFPLTMEDKYKNFIPSSQFQTGERRVFFRENTSTIELFVK